MIELKELVEEEISLLNENVHDLQVEDKYCSGFFTGDEQDFEDFLESLNLISSTSFTKSERHSKTRATNILNRKKLK